MWEVKTAAVFLACLASVPIRAAAAHAEAPTLIKTVVAVSAPSSLSPAFAFTFVGRSRAIPPRNGCATRDPRRGGRNAESSPRRRSRPREVRLATTGIAVAPSPSENDAAPTKAQEDVRVAAAAPPSPPTSGTAELWLDLRNDALTPQAASRLWQTLIGDADTPGGDEARRGVPFARFLVSDGEVEWGGNDDWEGGPAGDTTAERRGVHLVTLNNKAQGGAPVLADASQLLEAIDVASKRDRWIVLDGRSIKDDEIRFDATRNLADLLQGSFGVTPPLSEASNIDAGIGWTCFSKAEIIKAGMWMRSAGGAAVSGTEMVLESGILLPSGTSDDVPSDFEGIVSPHSASSFPMFAIIVPFDMGLIQTGLLLLEDGDDSDLA